MYFWYLLVMRQQMRLVSLAYAADAACELGVQARMVETTCDHDALMLSKRKTFQNSTMKAT